MRINKSRPRQRQERHKFSYLTMKNGSSACFEPAFFILKTDVAQWVGARSSELEGRKFDPRHSIDVCFEFPLFRVAVALNTRKTEH